MQGYLLRASTTIESAREAVRPVDMTRVADLVAPFATRWEPLVDEVDGVVLTNGLGDPADLMHLAERVRAMLNRRRPVLGICRGQLTDVLTRRAYVTGLNHGYAVDGDTL